MIKIEVTSESGSAKMFSTTGMCQISIFKIWLWLDLADLASKPAGTEAKVRSERKLLHSSVI